MIDDERWMARALELAAKAAGRTSPNPLVGAVVVKDGVCVGEGFHPRSGEPHAEVFALHDAGKKARGATVYVSLEPCSHHGRTPPCADLLIERGVARVVSAMEDPDSRVAGRGHARLREAGIRVDVGVSQENARRLNAPYLKHQRTGRPFVTLKMAMSLDGKTATRLGESQWITSEAARLDGHRLRNAHDAILVGVGTVLSDDPRLTTRLPDGEDARDPTRVILDTQARTLPTARVLTNKGDAETVIVVGEGADSARVEALRAAGADVWALPIEESRVSLAALLDRLGASNVMSALVEGGSRVHGGFVERHLADRIVAYVAPVVIGGDGQNAVGGAGFARLAEALRLGSWEVRAMPPDVRLDGYVQP